MSHLDRLADRLLLAQLEKDRVTEQFDTLKAEFIEALRAAGKFNDSTKALGNTRLKLTANRYFDIEEAKKMVSEDVLKECEVTAIDPKLLQLHLTPIQREKALKSHAQEFKLGVAVLED